jgi:CubicO group peptidase (beta-lactamase class C family)
METFMTILRRAFAVAVFTLLLPVHASRGATVGNDRALERSVDRYLSPLIDLDLFQGVVLVAHGDHVVLQKGYGFANVELGVRNEPGMVFRIASLSKPFTEVMLGRLVEEKRLALSDPLSRYIPGFPRGDEITLDMLRQHQAGIASMNSIPYDEEAVRPNTLDSLVTVIARQPLQFEPGTKARYSNGGYALLAYVIEKVTGRSYAEALQQLVARPLDLPQTRHESDQMLVPRRAYGYTVSPERRHALLVAPFQEMVTKTGGGSLVSTAGDLHRFLRAMNADNAIRADTWRELFGSDSVYGFQGRCPGYNLFMVRDVAHDVDVVVLCNNYAAGMVGTVGNDLLALARGARVAPPQWRADATIDSVRARACVGTFTASKGALPYGDTFAVRWKDGELVLYREGVPVDVLIPQGGDTFLLRNMWSEMRIPSDPGKQPTLRPLWIKREPVALERAVEKH